MAWIDNILTMIIFYQFYYYLNYESDFTKYKFITNFAAINSRWQWFTLIKLSAKTQACLSALIQSNLELFLSEWHKLVYGWISE